MPYNQYSLNDFVLDDYFIRWVKLPDPQTDAFWQNWLKENPGKEALVEEARQMVLSLSMPGKELREKDKKQLWQQINQRREAHVNKVKQKEIIPAGPFRIEWLYNGKIAASIAAVMVLAACWIWMNRSSNDIRYITQYGEIKNIDLPDGSHVTLNANSSLSFSDQWQEEREVHLTGEAFFEVAKKPGRADAKFVVHTQGIAIEVLGTQFNVHNRRNKVQVVLQEGKVELLQAGKQSDRIWMEPGDLVEYSHKNNRVHREKVNPFIYSSWKEVEMLFEDTPLYAIAQVLEDSRGLQVIFMDDSLKKLRFTGSLPNHDLDSYLLILSKSFGISVSKKGNQIILRKNN